MTLDLETGIDGLRMLICHHIAANAKMIANYASFMAFIEDGGALTRDLWKLVAHFCKYARQYTDLGHDALGAGGLSNAGSKILESVSQPLNHQVFKCEADSTPPVLPYYR
jgi:hypothetical protein